MSYFFYTPTPEATSFYTVLHTVPAGYFPPAEKHTMEAYFPKEMLDELSNLSERKADPAPKGGAAQDTNPQANASPQQEVRFDVCHSVQYAPWSPTPNDVRSEFQVIGKCKTLREANQLAMREVYEKYGGLAHFGMLPWSPPNRKWLRKAGDRSWPNTWKIEDGQLSFSVVNSKLQFTLKGEIYIVKAEGTVTV
ncbi:hypothetical protein F5B17DRAFT_1106 [Nemania serpens]|nr:hypothetical protein F5B17DRAFT_1106 [Nemania serpens]